MGHGIRTKQNSAHEGTAALQPRYTHARATHHMAPTSKDVDSFVGWSDADVLQVLYGTHRLHDWASVFFLARWHLAAMRCQPFVFFVFRVARSERSALKHATCTISRLLAERLQIVSEA